MSHPKDLKEKLDRLFQEGVVELLPERACDVKEKGTDGEAEIALKIEDAVNVLRLHVEKKPDWFGMLRSRKTTDGVLLAERKDCRWFVLIIESKRNIGKTSWAHAQKQFHDAALKARMIAAMVELPVDGVRLFTAYVEETPLKSVSPDPALGKIPSGPFSEEERHPWQAQKANIPHMTGEQTHRPLQLEMAEDGRDLALGNFSIRLQDHDQESEGEPK